MNLGRHRHLDHGTLFVNQSGETVSLDGAYIELRDLGIERKMEGISEILKMKFNWKRY